MIGTTEREEATMQDPRTIEDRRQSLLDQLEFPGLTTAEIEKIKLKLEVLDTQEA